jgi:hypothetical protein
MAAQTVVGPDGRTWKVRRRWVHRSVSWRGRKGNPVDLLDGADLAGEAADLPVVGVIFFAIAALLLAVAAVVFVVPAVIFLLEALFVLAVVALGAATRILFRRPWTVEARVAGTNEGREWKVVGWRASGELVETLADRIRSTGRVGDVTWTS